MNALVFISPFPVLKSYSDEESYGCVCVLCVLVTWRACAAICYNSSILIYHIAFSTSLVLICDRENLCALHQKVVETEQCKLVKNVRDILMTQDKQRALGVRTKPHAV